MLPTEGATDDRRHKTVLDGKSDTERMAILEYRQDVLDRAITGIGQTLAEVRGLLERIVRVEERHASHSEAIRDLRAELKTERENRCAVDRDEDARLRGLEASGGINTAARSMLERVLGPLLVAAAVSYITVVLVR